MLSVFTTCTCKKIVVIINNNNGNWRKLWQVIDMSVVLMVHVMKWFKKILALNPFLNSISVINYW